MIYKHLITTPRNTGTHTHKQPGKHVLRKLRPREQILLQHLLDPSLSNLPLEELHVIMRVLSVPQKALKPLWITHGHHILLRQLLRLHLIRRTRRIVLLEHMTRGAEAIEREDLVHDVVVEPGFIEKEVLGGLVINGLHITKISCIF